MPTYTYRCIHCKESTDGFFTLKETRPNTIPCQGCGKDAEYEMSAPMVLKASFLDGQRKKQWQDLREASKLNKAAAQTASEQEKKELQSEQKKIGYNFTKDTI